MSASDPEADIGPLRFAERDVAERDVMEYRLLGARAHWGLMFAARITLPHFSVSSEMSLPKSAGDPMSAVDPRSAIRAFTMGSASAELVSLLSLSTTSVGVPQVGRGPVASRSHIYLARIGVGIGDKLGDSFRRNRWIDKHEL
jgi:hypothetical protein